MLSFPTRHWSRSLLNNARTSLLIASALLALTAAASASTDQVRLVHQYACQVRARSLHEVQLKILFYNVTTLSGPDESYTCDAHGAGNLSEPGVSGEAQGATQPDAEEEDDNEFAPWSFQPACTEFLPDVGGTGSELCVYTNRRFENGRGISIFTTPKIAAGFGDLLTSLAGERLDGQDDAERSEQQGRTYTESVPGKGIGMRARRKLERGERLMATRPVLLAHMENALSTPMREFFLRRAVEQLPAATREAYYKLAKIYGKDEVIAQDVVKANSFEIEVGGRMHLAVFPEPSRMNHACGPSAQYHLDATRLTHYVHASRPIAQDEEISISYSTPFAPAVERQQLLQQSYGFKCACSRCSSATTSDAALKEIERLTDDLKDWTTTSQGTPEKAQRLVELYEQEGLQGFIDTAYGYASIAYNAVGDTKTAKEFASLAADAALLKDGPASQNLGTWREIMQNPESHWSWKWRRRG